MVFRLVLQDMQYALNFVVYLSEGYGSRVEAVRDVEICTSIGM